VVLISSIVIAFAVTVSLNPSGVNDLAFNAEADKGKSLL
jgi:hypothetical protein